MIAHLSGSVLAAAGTRVVLDVAGVGYAVAVTPDTALRSTVGRQLALHTKLIVREDDMALYGFTDADDLAAFELLLAVTGVGPKSALAVLSTLGAHGLADAVADEQEGAFKPVPGIGPKTARLIIVQLAGKVVGGSAAAGGDDVLVALTGLGWSESVAKAALDRTRAQLPDADTGTLLRATLTSLGPKR